MEITSEVANAFLSLVVIGALIFMALTFAAILPHVLDGLFED